MNRIHHKFLALLLFVLPALCCAQIYKWKDADGKIHFGDAPVAHVPMKQVTSEGNPETTFYDIKGSSIDQLLAAMTAQGPFDKIQGIRVFGLTHFQIHFDYHYKTSDGLCRITSVNVKYTNQFMMPRWVDKDRAAADLNARWATFYRNLQFHEDGHRAIGMKAVAAINAYLWSLAPRANCAGFDAEAKPRTAALMEQHDLEQLEYDLQTQHGRTQGAILK